MENEVYFKTDEALDVLGCLRHAIRCINAVGEDDQIYRWVILSIHAALQGACVCELTDTMGPLDAVREDTRKKLIAYYNQNQLLDPLEIDRPKMFLLNLPELLNAIRDASSNQNGAIEISDSELEWLKRFHSWRNQFVHFAPTSWSIELSGLPDLIALVARIIQGIFERGWAFRHLAEDDKSELGMCLNVLSDRQSIAAKMLLT